MVKRKGRFEDQSHFVSMYPIEECARRLEMLRSDALQIKMLRLSSDKVDFEVQLYEHGRLRVSGKGRLRRWEGTLTRVECAMQVHDGVVLWAILSLGMVIVGMLLIPLLTLSLIGVGMGTWAVLGSLCVASILVILLAANRVLPPDDTPSNLVALIEAALS